jgi:hypothetical protein
MTVSGPTCVVYNDGSGQGRVLQIDLRSGYWSAHGRYLSITPLAGSEIQITFENPEQEE